MYILHIDSITKQYETENLILVEHNEWFHVPLNCSFKYSAFTQVARGNMPKNVYELMRKIIQV